MKVKVPKIRDYLMIKVINGITKAGIQPDRKKVKNKKACRKPIKHGD